MTSSQRAEREVPWQPVQRTDWQFSPVKHHFDILLGKMLQPKEQSLEDVEVPYFKAQHVQWDKVLTEDLPTMWATPGEISSLRVRKGDLLVCEGGEVGRAAIVTEEPPKNCIIQNALHLVRPKQSGDVRFLRYLLQQAASHEWLNVLCNRATIAHFTAEKFSGMWIWAPPLPEQRTIADYLDRETSKIDALITEKKRLLSLLAEKRRALITQAVTCGLNRDVPMRDSGVEWLGAIPGHWEIEPLKHHLAGIEQGWSPQSDNFPANEDEWGVLKVGCVNEWEFNPDENKRLPFDLEPLEEYEIKPGDVLISRANTAELLGGAVLVHEVRPKLLLCDKLYRLRVQSARLRSDYLVSYLRSVPGRFEFERDATGASSSMKNISQESITNLRIPIPPRDEQEAIVMYTGIERSRLDSLYTATERIIELLQERRTALISAAVTGQIRARGES